jgi:uncharacterized protein
MDIRMELARILIRESVDAQVVELREVEGERIFPIVIGLNEAAAINRRLMGEEPPRPQTHELLATIIEELGWRIDRIVINDLSEHTFFARLILRNEGGDERDIDSRPSDAIALGVATEIPIYVAEHVLEQVCSES